MSGMRMDARAWALLLALALLWGAVFLLNAIALTGFGPLTVAWGRVGLGAAILTAALPVIGARLPASPRAWGAFLVMGALNNALPFALIVWGQTHIDSAMAAILVATTPVFTVLIAHVATADERLSASRLIGVALGFGGVAVLMAGRIGAAWSWHDLGQLAVLGAALSYACAGVYGRRFGALSPAPAAAGMLWASTVLLAPFALAVEAPWRAAPSAAAWSALAGLAAGGSALAYVLYFRLLATAGATNLLLVTLLMPAVAVGLGWAVLGERLDSHAWAGLALIAAALVAIDGRPYRWARRRE